MKTVTILAIIGLIMTPIGGGALWTHNHGSKPILANKAGISTLVIANRIAQDIRHLDKRCHDLRMMIEQKHSDLLQIELSPNKDPRILELKSRIIREIEGYQKLLEQQQERLHDEESREQILIENLATA